MFCDMLFTETSSRFSVLCDLNKFSSLKLKAGDFFFWQQYLSQLKPHFNLEQVREPVLVQAISKYTSDGFKLLFVTCSLEPSK